LTGSGPLGVAVVVEDALHATVAAAMRPMAAAADERRYAGRFDECELSFSGQRAVRASAKQELFQKSGIRWEA
jgi:hypothetical protein